MSGVKAATGDVIVFLDSHCEAAEGTVWEPSLNLIYMQREIIVYHIASIM